MAAGIVVCAAKTRTRKQSVRSLGEKSHGVAALAETNAIVCFVAYFAHIFMSGPVLEAKVFNLPYGRVKF